MNLAQIRTMVKDMLHSSGQNTAVPEDTFWTDGEINAFINAGQRELQKHIKLANSEYFDRIMSSADSAFVTHGRSYDPGSLTWVADTSEYTLPPDLVRLKLIWDNASSDRVRLRHIDLRKEDFVLTFGEDAGTGGREFWYTIVAARTLIIRPIPQEVRNFTLIYERTLPPLRDFSSGNVTVNHDATAVTLASATGISDIMPAGSELIVAASGTAVPTPNPSLQYPKISSFTSDTALTLDAPYLDEDGSNVSGVGYICSMVSEIPDRHHDLLVYYALKELFAKGPNPSLDAADYWRQRFVDGLPALTADVEQRDDSTVETVEEYLGDIHGTSWY